MKIGTICSIVKSPGGKWKWNEEKESAWKSSELRTICAVCEIRDVKILYPSMWTSVVISPKNSQALKRFKNYYNHFCEFMVTSTLEVDIDVPIKRSNNCF